MLYWATTGRYTSDKIVESDKIYTRGTSRKVVGEAIQIRNTMGKNKG